MSHRITAGVVAGSLVAAPLTLLVAAPAQADTERRGTCASGVYELSVDREDRGYEVSVDLDRLAPGQRWRIVLRHDGDRIASVVRRADREGDLDVERYRRNTTGGERFSFVAKRVSGAGSCRAAVTVG